MASRYSLLLGILIVLLAQILMIAWEVTPARNGGAWDLFWGPDSYTHLNQVLQIVLSGNWYDHLSYETNAPFGVESHYTRLLDIYLLLGALTGSLVTDFDSALRGWAMLSGPALHLAAVPLLYWGTRPFLPAAGFILLVLLFVLQRSLSIDFVAGQADHHSLLNFLMLASLMVLLRLLSRPQGTPLALWLGALATLLVWASPEGLVPVLLVLLTLGGLWLVEGAAYLSLLQRVCASFALTAVVALVCEYPPERWVQVHYDRFSIVHGVLAVLLYLATWCAGRIQARFNEHWTTRLGISVVMAGLVGAVLYTLYPGFFQHPYAHIDPFVLKYVYGAITIEGSLLSGSTLNHFVILLEVSAACLVGLFFLVRITQVAAPERFRYLFYLIALALLIPYALTSARALPFLALAAVVPWAEALVVSSAALRSRLAQQRWLPVMAWGSLLVILGLGNWTAAFAYRAMHQLDVNFRNIPHCNYSRVTPFLSSLAADPGAASGAGVVMAPMFAGSELVYRSPFSVVGSSMHGNVDGIKDTFTFFSSTGNDQQALRVVRERKVHYVLYCRNVGDQLFAVMNSNFGSLIGRLFMGRVPGWLERVRLPDEVREEFDLYRVRWR